MKLAVEKIRCMDALAWHQTLPELAANLRAAPTSRVVAPLASGKPTKCLGWALLRISAKQFVGIEQQQKKVTSQLGWRSSD